MIGRALEGDVEGDLDAERAGAWRAGGESPPGCRGAGARPCGRLRGCRSPRDFRDRRARRRCGCWDPCARCRRSDGPAADRGHRSPSRRRRAGAPRHPPACRAPASPGAERGNISYQLEKRARSRSTSMRERRVVTLDELRIGTAARELAQRLALREHGPLLARRAPDRPARGPTPARRRASDSRQAARVRAGQRRALLQIDLDVLRRLMFLRQSPPPALQVIDPCLDGEEIAAERLDGEAPLPAIVADGSSSACRATATRFRAGTAARRRQRRGRRRTRPPPRRRCHPTRAARESGRSPPAESDSR